MRKIFLAMAALSAIAAAAPAAAQVPNTSTWSTVRDDRIQRLADRIDQGIRSDLISRSEGSRLLYRLSQLRRTKLRYRSNGFSAWERNSVDDSIERLRREVGFAEQYASGDGRYRTPDYGRPDYGQGDDTVFDPTPDGWDDNAWDRDNDGWDDRNYGRDDAFGQNQAWDRDDDGWDDRDTPVSSDDDGWDDGDAAVISDDDDYVAIGGSANVGVGAGLRVGDRAPSNLAAVPTQLRGRYPDGSQVYFRYRDGWVYQIDRRTDVILWVGQLPY